EALVDQPGAVGQRRRTGVIARLILIAWFERLDQLNRPAARLCAMLQCQRQAGANQTTANDRQRAHDQATSAAAAIKASISATAFGTPPVRISQPVRVTTTSSSIRTPMP